MSRSEDHKHPEFKIGLNPKDSYRIKPPSGSTIKIAHITDTHLGLTEKTEYTTYKKELRPESRRVPSFENFRRTIDLLQQLNPDVIIHTGDIIDNSLINIEEKYENLKEALPNQLDWCLFLYIHGNHDNTLRRQKLCRLLPGWDILPLDGNSPIPLVDGQIEIIGKDYQNVDSPGNFSINTHQTSEDAIKIGAFHQSIRHISDSYDANVHINHLAPDDGTDSSYYDLLLLGHMHIKKVRPITECMLIADSTLGLNAAPTIGLLTFSNAASHYQRYRI
jgi:DNA repair exonuclease SbcCD nuclease subunit